MEQLLVRKQVPITAQPLMKLYPGDLTSYVKTLRPSQIITFTPKGTPTSPVKLAQQLVAEPNPLLLVGGFAHGELSPSILDLADQRIALDPDFLPAATIIGMMIHAIEVTLNLTDQRFEED